RTAERELEPGDRVPRGLDAREQAVEGGDIAADRVGAEDVRLDERRPRAGERVVDARPGPEVALEEHLHELRDELAEVRMEAVDVLRPFDLRKLRLRPRELEVDLAVELALRGRHEKVFDGDPVVA